MSLRGVDLNLLPVLQALLREESVSRAAEALGLSQSATSQALARLRYLLKDPLLVKVGRRMKLTRRAQRMRALTDQSCASIATLLSEEDFDPGAAVRSFSIATSDYTALLVARELLPLLREKAPGISLRFVDVSPGTREQLLNGSLDLAVTARVPALEGLSMLGGFMESLVCVAGIDHPLAKRDGISIAELNSHRQLGTDMAPYRLLDFVPGHPTEQVRIGPSHLFVLPLLAASSGSIAIVTRALGRLAARYAPLKLIELLDPGEPIEVCIAWSPVDDVDPAHQWLRDQLVRIMDGQFQQAPNAAPPVTRQPGEIVMT